MKFWFADILHRPLVWLVDYDGAINLRRAYNYGGQVWAHRASFGIRTVFLTAGGEVPGGSYVEKWVPANKWAKQMFAEEAV